MAGTPVPAALPALACSSPAVAPGATASCGVAAVCCPDPSAGPARSQIYVYIWIYMCIFIYADLYIGIYV